MSAHSEWGENGNFIPDFPGREGEMLLNIYIAQSLCVRYCVTLNTYQSAFEHLSISSEHIHNCFYVCILFSFFQRQIFVRLPQLQKKNGIGQYNVGYEINVINKIMYGIQDMYAYIVWTWYMMWCGIPFSVS